LLTDKLTEKQINIALDNMEKGEEGLDKAYNDTVNRIENRGQGIRELAKRTLFWIVCAKRPLVVSSCAGLVTVDSNIIRLVHYTTQEYFQRHGLKSFEDVQRNIIASSCLTYLSYDVFADGYLEYVDLQSRLRQNAFFKYAAQNWVYHIQDIQESVRDLALKFLMDDGKASASSQVLLSYHAPRQFCGMHLVAYSYFGLSDIAVRLLQEKDTDTKDSFGRTPLSYAVTNGNVRLVELLLAYNVDLYSECRDGWTPFSRAIEGGNAAVIQIILAKGAKIDYRYKLALLLQGVSGFNHIRIYL
jgi:hypothetical protein